MPRVGGVLFSLDFIYCDVVFVSRVYGLRFRVSIMTRISVPIVRNISLLF